MFEDRNVLFMKKAIFYLDATAVARFKKILGNLFFCDKNQTIVYTSTYFEPKYNFINFLSYASR